MFSINNHQTNVCSYTKQFKEEMVYADLKTEIEEDNIGKWKV